MDVFAQLREFRQATYQCLCRAKDATFELIDAILLTRNAYSLVLGSNASKKDAIASRNNEYYSLRCGNIMVPVAAILSLNRHDLSKLIGSYQFLM